MYMKIIKSRYYKFSTCSTLKRCLIQCTSHAISFLLNVPRSLLFQSPFHGLSNAILQADKWLVSKSLFCLVNAEVPCHAGICVSLACKSRRLSNQPAESLAEESNDNTHVLGNYPDVIFAVGAAGCIPYQAAKVPKVYRSIIGDEEGLAVDALIVQRHGTGGVGKQEGARS